VIEAIRMAYGARDIPVPTREMTGTRGREWAKGPAPAGIPALRATPDTGVHLPGLGLGKCVSDFAAGSAT